MKNYTFKLAVLEGDKEVFQESLSYEAMISLISSSPDTEAFQSLYDHAATHQSAIVREYVAGKDNLSKNSVDILSADKSINVLRALVRSAAFKKHACDEILVNLILLDIEIARSIADYYEEFKMTDSDRILNALLQINEPAVMTNLINNYSTPKKVLKELANYPDSFVATAAKERLSS